MTDQAGFKHTDVATLDALERTIKLVEKNATHINNSAEHISFAKNDIFLLRRTQSRLKKAIIGLYFIAAALLAGGGFVAWTVLK